MKKQVVFLLGIFISLQSFAVQRLQVEVKGDSVWMQCEHSIQTFNTPGYHSVDSTLGALAPDSAEAKLPEISRGRSCGQFEGVGVYHLTSGLIPENFSDSIHVTFRAPGKVIFCQGKMYRGEGDIIFPNLFVGREFPIFWAHSTNYSVDFFPLNSLDTVRTVFIWTDSGRVLLDSARVVVAEAIREVGKYAPQFWHKHIQYWGGSQYTLTIMLGVPAVGLEHFNAPYVGIPRGWFFIMKDLTIHELFHSLVGKDLMPASYFKFVGYHPTDVLGFYEGLTTLIGERYLEFPAGIQWRLAHALAMANMSTERDLIKLSYVPGELESPYWNGRLYWTAMAEIIDIDDWLSWLFESKLINRDVPVPIMMDSIYTWLNEFKPGCGDYAKKVIAGEYYHDADSLLQYHGYRKVYPINYIGPYYWKDGKVGGYICWGMDRYNLPLDYRFICVLVGNDSLSLGPGGEGMKLLRQHPDSVFSILVSSSRGREVIRVSKNFYFPSGEPLFIQGKIHFAQVPLARREETLKFWRQLVRQ